MFRDAAYRCLDCPDAPLREFGRRLACDACVESHGAWFDADELAEVLRRATPG